MSTPAPIADHTFLVTGGTGSFGRTVAAYLLEQGGREVRIFSRDEAKQDQMRNDFDDERLRFYLGDVRDFVGVEKVMRGVDFVFHAAALKQVPSCEFFPMQAVMTNITGSEHVIRAATDHGVKKVVCLSTDKAVYPINAMGLSKALMEKVAQSYARQLGPDDTVVSCVRYGNVMYSRGSVIPLFVQQIKEEQPITLTEPGMTRFLMALSESVELVAHAFEHAGQGDIFIKKAPACTVQDLAQACINLFHSTVETRIIGMRHGEKIYETLATKEELATAEDRESFYRLRMDARDLNYKQYFSEGNTREAAMEDYHSHNTRRLDVSEVEEVLRSLPEIQDELNARSGR